MKHYYLSLNECSRGHRVSMVSLDHREDNGGGSGTRLTSQKCCGSWTTINQWLISRADMKEIGELFLNLAAED